LTIADGKRELTKEQISEATGIPTGESSGKVEPHILYGAYMNLLILNKTGNKYRLEKTDIGEIIHKEDPSIIEEISLFLCHYYLTSVNYGADMWCFIVRNILSKYNNRASESVIMEELKNRYKKSNIKLTPFIKSYEESFSRLSVIKIDDNQNQNSDRTLILSPAKYQNDCLFLYAYTLLDEWEKSFGARSEVVISDISNILKWGKAFGWDPITEFNVLEKIAEKGIIKINKQLSPATVVKISDSISIRSKIYSLLF
jgi:hypothetical protein